MRRTLLIILVLFSLNGFGQNFKWEATLDTIPADGFYKIILTPSITNKLNSQFSDLRVFDENGKETPYFLQSERALNEIKLFKEYPIINKTLIKNCYSTIIVKNKSKSKINNLCLIIRNSEVVKQVRLSGSDDLKNWYVIKDNFYLQHLFNNSSTTESKLLPFPLSNYEYYKLDINDSINAPINILNIGYYDFSNQEGLYSSLPDPEVHQSDSIKSKKSYIRIRFNENSYINKLYFNIEGPAFYKRDAAICILKEKKGRKGKREKYFETTGSFELKSDSKNTIDINVSGEQEFYLIIENNDNPPLKIQSVKAFQLNHILISHLQKGKKYFVRFGDNAVKLPVYDIEYFRNTIPENLPAINIKSIVQKIKDKEKQEDRTFFTSKWFIWSALILIVVILFFMSIKTIKEMGAKN